MVIDGLDLFGAMVSVYIRSACPNGMDAKQYHPIMHQSHFPQSYHNADFVVSGGTAINFVVDNMQSYQWKTNFALSRVLVFNDNPGVRGYHY